jgi:hypothetical protein
VAMPGDRDERTVCADVLASDPLLCTAWAEVHESAAAAYASGHDHAQVIRRWQEAEDAALDNSLVGLRAALSAAVRAAGRAGYDTTHEDATLAMLPPVVPS